MHSGTLYPHGKKQNQVSSLLSSLCRLRDYSSEYLLIHCKLKRTSVETIHHPFINIVRKINEIIKSENSIM